MYSTAVRYGPTGLNGGTSLRMSTPKLAQSPQKLVKTFLILGMTFTAKLQVVRVYRAWISIKRPRIGRCPSQDRVPILGGNPVVRSGSTARVQPFPESGGHSVADSRPTDIMDLRVPCPRRPTISFAKRPLTPLGVYLPSLYTIPCILVERKSAPIPRPARLWNGHGDGHGRSWRGVCPTCRHNASHTGSSRLEF
jgi:hypothetical protein